MLTSPESESPRRSSAFPRRASAHKEFLSRRVITGRNRNGSLNRCLLQSRECTNKETLLDSSLCLVNTCPISELGSKLRRCLSTGENELPRGRFSLFLPFPLPQCPSLCLFLSLDRSIVSGRLPSPRGRYYRAHKRWKSFRHIPEPAAELLIVSLR